MIDSFGHRGPTRSSVQHWRSDAYRADEQRAAIIASADHCALLMDFQNEFWSGENDFQIIYYLTYNWGGVSYFLVDIFFWYFRRIRVKQHICDDAPTNPQRRNEKKIQFILIKCHIFTEISFWNLATKNKINQNDLISKQFNFKVTS